MNVFHEIPLEATRSAFLSVFSMRAEETSSDVDAPLLPQPVFRDIQWKGKSGPLVGGENTTGFNRSMLSSISPLDALPLTLKSFDDISPPKSLGQLAMDGDGQCITDESLTPSNKSILTLRERRLLPKSPQLNSLEIYVPPVRSEFLPVSTVVVGSSDFIIWLDETVSNLCPSSLAAARTRKYLLAVADEPTEEGFQLVSSILRDQNLIKEFTDKLITHMIRFNEEESSDGLRSAWSDSTCSELSDYDVSPSDIVMEVLRSINDAIDEASLLSDPSQWPLVSDSLPQERDLTELYDPAWF